MKFVKTNKFFDELQTPVVVLCYFWSHRCLTCNQVDLYLIKLDKAYKDKIKILKIDGERELELIDKFSINVVPTFIIFKDLKLKSKITGFRNEFEIEKEIRKLI